MYVCICVYAQIHLFSHAYSIENNSQGNSLYSALEWCCTILICPYNIVPFIFNTLIVNHYYMYTGLNELGSDNHELQFRLCMWLYSWNRVGLVLVDRESS